MNKYDLKKRPKVFTELVAIKLSALELHRLRVAALERRVKLSPLIREYLAPVIGPHEQEAKR